MLDSTTAAERLRATRMSLGLSQSRLARVSGISRFKLCTYELGDRSLSADEQNRVRRALHAEAERLRRISADFDLVGLGGQHD